MKEKLLSTISDFAARRGAERAIKHHRQAVARWSHLVETLRDKIHPGFYAIPIYEELVREHERAIRVLEKEFGIRNLDSLKSKTV